MTAAAAEPIAYVPFRVRQALAWEAVRELGKVRSRPVAGGLAWYIDFRPDGPKVYTYRTPWGAEIRFATEIDARLALQEIRRRVAEGMELALAIDSIRPRDRAHVMSRARAWLEEKRREERQGQKSPGSIAEIEGHIRNHWGAWQGTSILEIRAGHLADWKNELLEKGLAPGTVRNVLAYFHAFLFWLASRDEIEVGRIPVFPTVQVPKTKRPVYTWEQQGAVLNAVSELVGESDTRFGLLLVAAELALRPNEARALAVADIGVDQVHVRSAVKGGTSDAPIRGTKTGTARVLPMPALFGAWAALYLTPEMRLRQRLAFPNRDGKPWGMTRLRALWIAACARAGVPYVPIRDATRKSTPTEMMKRLGTQYAALRALLGHAHQSTTEIYVEPDNVELAGAVHDMSTMRRGSLRADEKSGT